MRWMKRSVMAGAAALAVAAVVACTTSPLGRQQLTLFPDAQLAEMSVHAFQQIQDQVPESTDEGVNRYVQCVADAITADVKPPAGEWQVKVFQDDTVNAFALPGGEIGVNTGLLRAAENQHQLAAVVGHEVAHVLARHGNERVSQQFAAEQGLALVAVLASDRSPQTQQLLLAALGVGAQVGILLPFSRAQELEADAVGLDLMASAGFDPRQSVDLWHNMAREGGDEPPRFLSTHPPTKDRIEALAKRAETVMGDYEKAVAAGRQPNCERPS
ncbi:M48 family metallopeptidase [Ectothiorhodospiraceae bacterium 2226]|nr:M48 family metallopeptidase [Ectothiorhodospiraceae bacterium 2226]